MEGSRTRNRRSIPDHELAFEALGEGGAAFAHGVGLDCLLHRPRRAPARPPQRQNKEGRDGARPSRESHGLSSGAGQSTCGKTGQTSFATTHAVGPFDVWFWFDRISPLLWPLLLSV